ncbi:MAG: hypothetical protein E4H30_00305 [Methanomassiliicoccus sp.]|nr:MAG: hypothetical protein E4H30_00305 [Methanomassiliicoccus sp.]
MARSGLPHSPGDVYQPMERFGRDGSARGKHLRARPSPLYRWGLGYVIALVLGITIGLLFGTLN